MMAITRAACKMSGQASKKPLLFSISTHPFALIAALSCACLSALSQPAQQFEIGPPGVLPNGSFAFGIAGPRWVVPTLLMQPPTCFLGLPWPPTPSHLTLHRLLTRPPHNSNNAFIAESFTGPSSSRTSSQHGRPLPVQMGGRLRFHQAGPPGRAKTADGSLSRPPGERRKGLMVG
jgi:hypothetical protein